MKREEAKKYIEIKQEIETILDRIRDLDESVVQVNAVISDMPKGSKDVDRFAEWIAKKDELRNEYLFRLNELTALQIKIEKWVKKLPRHLRTLARLKYLEGKTYDEMAEKMNAHSVTIWRWDKKLFENESNSKGAI